MCSLSIGMHPMHPIVCVPVLEEEGMRRTGTSPGPRTTRNGVQHRVIGRTGTNARRGHSLAHVIPDPDTSLCEGCGR